MESTLQRIRALEAELDEYRDILGRACREVPARQVSPDWLSFTRWLQFRNRLFPEGTLRRRFLHIGSLLTLNLYQTAKTTWRRLRPLSPRRLYARWIATYEPDPAELKRQRRTSSDPQPRVSILLPMEENAGRFLDDTLKSVLDQTYQHWELCLAVPPAQEPAVRKMVQRFGERDSRLRLCTCPAGADVSGLWTAAREAATGAYVALVKAGDTLAPFALFEIVRAIDRAPEADFLYSDEDQLNRHGARRDPHFKPGWSPDTLRSHNYIGDLCVWRRTLLDRVGDVGAESLRDDHYALTLRTVEQAREIVHVPQVLYHRRKRVPSEEKKETGRRALEEHLRRLKLPGEVKAGPYPGTYQVIHPLPSRPLVSIIIPNRDQAGLLLQCLDSIGRSTYSSHEILIVENGSGQSETLACYRELAQRSNVRILKWDQPFNYAALNNFAADQAAGEVLVFLNNDIEVLAPDWLERLLEHALRPAVGAAGAKLYFPDDTIQHAGLVVSRYPMHRLVGLPRESPGYQNRLVTTQNVSAVTGACLMARRAVFEEVRGFDEKFAMVFNDVDLCLKMRQRGYLIVWTPYAELYHHESATRGSVNNPRKQEQITAEMALFAWKWDPVLCQGDPYHNPSLAQNYRDHFVPV
jgi:GT2 family glycosyltransferase